MMELRSVLTKKKMVEQPAVERVIQDIEESAELVFPDTSDVLAANSLQQETLLYPMDCLVLALARDQNSTLVTFDAELRDVDAVSPRPSWETTADSTVNAIRLGCDCPSNRTDRG